MKNNKGSIIVFALIVLAFILIAAFSVAAVTLVERRSANVSVNSSTAFQNADKGMEEFLQQLYKELDQNDTLDTLANRLNEIYSTTDYSCAPGNEAGAIPANIGDEDTEFIITAFRENPDAATGIDVAGWKVVIPIVECETPLADVARFKAAGNFNNAVRAVFLKLRDSLSRGLVAKWGLEDRAQVARIVPDTDREKRISWIAQDSSKQFHTLTLCPIRYDVPDPPDDDEKPMVDVLNETDGSITNYFVYQEADVCEYSDNEDLGMSPMRGYGDTGDDEYDADGAWVAGIVEEELPQNVTAAHGDTSSEEALYFDGSTYLAMYTDNNCEDDAINCVDSANDDKLLPEEGIGISLWVKLDDAANDDGYLVSRFENNKGFELYLSDGDVCFRLNNTEGCASDSSSKIDDTEWRHIAVRWSKGGSGTEVNRMRVFVDAERTDVMKSFTSTISYDSGDIMTVGARDEGGSIGNYFTGTIDDVRIWDRGLSNYEVWRLCAEAETGDGDDHDQGDHPAGCSDTLI